MKNSTPIVLGIDPGARQIGVSVFAGTELIFYGLRSIRKKTENDTLRKVRKVLSKLLEYYRIEYVALEKIVFVQQQTSFVNTVYIDMVRFLREQDVSIFIYEPKLIRKAICGKEKPTKRNTAIRIIQSYSELERYFIMPKIWQKRYYAQMFDAIAAALVCAKEAAAVQASTITGKE